METIAVNVTSLYLYVSIRLADSFEYHLIRYSTGEHYEYLNAMGHQSKRNIKVWK